MAQTLDEIKRHIEDRRGRLVQDVNELEARVRETVNWRVQFQRHTSAILGGAFAFGAIIALLLPARSED